MKAKQKGFTLIELLVVISIIGLLAAVVLVSVNDTRKKARNTKRAAEIKQLVTAFNLAINSNSPLPTSVTACISSSCYGNWSSYVSVTAVDNTLAPYIQKPTDPTDSLRSRGGYLYINPSVGQNSLFDGSFFPSGAYVIYVLEPPLNPVRCPFGQVWQASSDIVECWVRID